MVSGLYAASDIVFAAVLIMILLHDVITHIEPTAEEKAYRKLLIWVLFFCLQDTVWGICGSSLGKSVAAFWVSSTVFHLSTILTTYFWLNYILIYLGDKVKNQKLYRHLCQLIIMVQVILLVSNIFTPTIFYISEDCEYHTAFLRPIAFLNQYIFYLIIGIVTGIFAVRNRTNRDRSKYLSVFFFAAAPVLSGGFQFLYPDGPFYAVGYFLGCIIIHLFVITKERAELESEKERLQNEEKLAEQVAILNMDSLTHVSNRKSYEDKINSFANQIPEGFTYISMDINGLKVTNDELGHNAGDEMLQGAVYCMVKCFCQYGGVYRIGGDEFAAILELPEGELEKIQKSFEEEIKNWDGNLVHSLAVACGYAQKREFPDESILELSKIADKRMYAAKARYYKEKGIDRRGQQSAHTALYGLYAKILKINITEDTYKEVNVMETEKTEDRGYSDRISTWFSGFGKSGQVHPEDLQEYLSHTDLKYLKDYFEKGNRNYKIFYRRKFENEYKHVMLEMIPADDYEPDHQTLFLYVKELGIELNIKK